MKIDNNHHKFLKGLISINDITNDDINYILNFAKEIQSNIQSYGSYCNNKILALLFFESSTRTSLSFTSAMHRLGGSIISTDIQSLSITKGESLEDTVKVISSYADAIIIRHNEMGIIQRLKKYIDIPVINAGDGTGEHPSQTLIDLFTIYNNFYDKRDITIGLYGDLKYSRPNHSLLIAASRFGANFICIAPKELQMPQEYVDIAIKNGSKVEFYNDPETVYPMLDVLYVSRLQKERLPAHLDYEKLKELFTINTNTLDHFKKEMIIMHPLPRVGEIDPLIDQDPRAKYFEQVKNSIPVRMAI